MVKPRKMLGDAASPQCQKLMRLIETQSKPTLALWALQLAEKRYLPIYTAAYPKDKRALQAIRICRECARNSGSVKEIKPLLKELIQLARDELAEPAVVCAVCCFTDSDQCTWLSVLWCGGGGVYCGWSDTIQSCL